MIHETKTFKSFLDLRNYYYSNNRDTATTGTVKSVLPRTVQTTEVKDGRDKNTQVPTGEGERPVQRSEGGNGNARVLSQGGDAPEVELA